MNRYLELEEYQSRVRDGLARVVPDWLAAARVALERLTMAAMDPAVDDAAFDAMVEAAVIGMPSMIDGLDTAALSRYMEMATGGALASGFAARQVQGSSVKVQAARPDKRGKRCGNSWIPSWKECRLDIGSTPWEGNAKSMQSRAAAAMKSAPVLSHPDTGIEMRITQDGIRKSLHAARLPVEFMAAAAVVEVFLHSEKRGEVDPDRKGRRQIKAFHKFTANIKMAGKPHSVEIVSKELAGDPVHHLKVIRIKE